MTTLLFYERPVPLNSGVHLKTRLKATGNFDFSASTNSIPLAVIEFVDAAREYPIAFAGEEGGAMFPIALVGMRKNENLFVSESGTWEGRYIPAFVRRYPFVLGEKENANDFDVFVDEAYEGFGGKSGERLFNDQGESSDWLKQMLEFLSNYQGEIERTRRFVERLQELKLLVPRMLQSERENETPLVLQGFSVVDEQRLMELSDADLLELARNGSLAWIYAHLMSLGNVPGLSMRLAKRVAAEGNKSAS